MTDKKHELEKRLENVKGALGAPAKKPAKKGRAFCQIVEYQCQLRVFICSVTFWASFLEHLKRPYSTWLKINGRPQHGVGQQAVRNLP